MSGENIYALYFQSEDFRRGYDYSVGFLEKQVLDELRKPVAKPEEQPSSEVDDLVRDIRNSYIQHSERVQRLIGTITKK